MDKNNRDTSVNFEERFFDQLEKNQDELKAAIAANTKETQEVSARVKKIERKVFPETLPAWYTNQRLLYLALGSIFIFLLILATVTHTKVPSLSP